MLDYGEFVPDALLESPDASLATMGAKMELVPQDIDKEFTNAEACVDRVVSGTHAHIETFSYIQLLYRELGFDSKVYHMTPQLYKGHLVFLFKKHTPWRNKFNTGLQRLVEAGLVFKWHEEVMDESPRSKGEVGAPLLLSHLQHTPACLLSVLITTTWTNTLFRNDGNMTKRRFRLVVLVRH